VTASRASSSAAEAELAGYAWLVRRFGLAIPRPVRLAGILGKNRPRDAGDWLVLPETYAPDPTLAAQMTFAFKWEGIDLAVLDALFQAIAPGDVAAAVRSAPTGAYMRRLWFLYEWLTGTRLDLPDSGKVRAVPVVDPELQIALDGGEISARHRVRNNLPGTPAFCPMVRRTPAIAAWQTAALDAEARRALGQTHRDVIARAAAFLLLGDSRASYDIEGERPSRDRLRRWAQSIARAGTVSLSIADLEALQREVIGDARFVHLGLRVDDGFVGQRDRVTREPLPDHINARPEDLVSLVEGIDAFDRRAGRGAMDPIAAAASTAFGFVYVHPFEDGNGRLHRWIIHHVLAEAGYSAPGLVFPVSAVLLREIDDYKRVLESYSARLLPHIAWEPMPDGNVSVMNDTASWYRFFDATAHTEFLYRCVEATVKIDLPYEIAYLMAYDRFVAEVSAIVDMPAQMVDLLHNLLRQNEGRLSNRARSREFATLTDAEGARIEALYAESHADLVAAPSGRELDVRRD
jgi:hypothetical protein